MIARSACLAFLVVLVSLAGCNKEKPLPTEVVLLSTPGGNLTEMETALRQEQSYRGNLLSMLRAPAEAVRMIPLGDPAARDALQAEIAALTLQLEEKLAMEDEKLTEPTSVLTGAEESLAEAKEELEAAQDAYAGYSGRFLVAPEKKRCGDDGCGGDCGSCEWDEVCANRYCRCLPSCNGKMCGDDGCGGVCGDGECGTGRYCSEDRKCLSTPTETECRKSCRGIPEGLVTVTRSVKDHGFSSKRSYDPWRVGTLSELEEYRKTLGNRMVELNGLIAGSASLSQSKDETQAKLDAAKGTLNTLLEEHKTLKKDLATATKEARKLKDEAKVAAEANVAALQTAASDKGSHIDVIRNEVKDLTSKVRDLEAQAKRLDKEAPQIVLGKDKLLGEIARTDAAISAWRSLEAQVSTKRAAVSSAQAAVDRARQALAAVKESVDAAKEALISEATPVLEAKGKELAASMFPAFTDPIGMALPDGLNVESPRFLRIHDESRLPDMITKVNALLEARRTAYAALDDEKKKLYPDWPAETELLVKYSLFLDALSQSTARQASLESRMTDLRKTMAEPEVERVVEGEGN